jgi:hypothetical protein
VKLENLREVKEETNFCLKVSKLIFDLFRVFHAVCGVQTFLLVAGRI